ncbi:hypothetical protein L917_05597 [Phytophthora nicotianae]|uniref:Uncharacterized protein n=2 Tax=Phytophthora nicotianae TaxID=4792 RepID=W2Q9L8_PHYN3|nr:hypothetical protein PPTG_22860 [Phytophthora nicotianae INRA-310]ETL97048.1 hypothetical protein L917_05597 [Phytophthora nicotianae]ETN09249.1 hypothetical protein PPTG_22860 [Phytophthora nicotianae INRA-310]
MGVDTNLISISRRDSAARRRGDISASTPGGGDAASGAGGYRRPVLEILACSRAADLHEEEECNQVELDHSRPPIESVDGYINGNTFKTEPGRETGEAGFHKKKK